MYQPLADRIRPQTLDEVVGQRHILGQDGLLRRIVESGKIPNMVFYGPSGTGKTTVANIIANQSGRTLRRLNATTASLSDIRDIIGRGGHPRWLPTGCCSIWTRSSISIKSSSSPCWSSSRTARSPSSPPPRRTPIFTCSTPFCPAPPCSSSSMLTAADVLPAVDRGFRLHGGARWGWQFRCEDGVREHHGRGLRRRCAQGPQRRGAAA